MKIDPLLKLHSLTKEHPWLEHLTRVPKQRVGALSSVSAFNHKVVPLSYAYC